MQDDSRRRPTLTMKVCLAGDFRVGKTSLVRRFVADTFSDDYIATLGSKVMTKRFPVADPRAASGSRDVTLTIWDVMGQKGFREMLQDAFFFNVKGTLYVCDATRRETLPALSSWATSVDLVAGSVPSVVLLNKADLNEEGQITEAEVGEFCKTYGWRWLPTSAKTGENVENAFRLVAEAYLETLPSTELPAR